MAIQGHSTQADLLLPANQFIQKVCPHGSLLRVALSLFDISSLSKSNFSCVPWLSYQPTTSYVGEQSACKIMERWANSVSLAYSLTPVPRVSHWSFPCALTNTGPCCTSSLLDLGSWWGMWLPPRAPAAPALVSLGRSKSSQDHKPFVNSRWFFPNETEDTNLIWWGNL